MIAPTRSALASSLALPPERRMRRPREFQRAYASGKRLGNEHFTVSAKSNGLSHPRLGMSVAARTLRRAVARNRVRRLIRESFRLNQLSLPPLDLVIGVRTAVRSADNAQLRAQLQQIWKKISAAWA